MKQVTMEGKTVEEAIKKALGQLGVGKEQVEIEVLKEETKGLFGMEGTHRAKVRVRVKEDTG